MNTNTITILIEANENLNTIQLYILIPSLNKLEHKCQSYSALLQRNNNTKQNCQQQKQNKGRQDPQAAKKKTKTRNRKEPISQAADNNQISWAAEKNQIMWEKQKHQFCGQKRTNLMGKREEPNPNLVGRTRANPK